MGPSSAAPAGVHGSGRSLRTWWSSWPEATPVGVTTALSVPWPIWGTRSPIKRSEHSSAAKCSAPPEREKSTTWKDFIRSHMSVLADTDFFTAEVLTWRGLVTYYVLIFIHLDTRRVSIAGITEHPDSAWLEQMGRNVTWEGWGFLQDRRYLLHDRDAKFAIASETPSWRAESSRSNCRREARI